MKKFTAVILAAVMVLSLCACSHSGSIESSSNTGSGSSSGSNGYTAPKSEQSASDYIKENDADLYDTITDRYNSATGKSGSQSSSDGYDYDKGFGYTAPKAGQSFSDYVKEQDPDLYSSLFN